VAENTKIEWCHSTFNPWRGCTRVSKGCVNCYAETLAHRNPKVLGVWGPQGTRVVASEHAWKEPVRWNKAAAAAGERHRVFCASLADVFEAWEGPMEDSRGVQWYLRADGSWTTSDHYPDTIPLSAEHVRARLFDLIEKTPHLDWLLLTKRPENVAGAVPETWRGGFPPNVWIGTSVEDQETADRRIPELLRIPAAVRFLSCEPLLGPVNLGGSFRWGVPVPCTELDRNDGRIHWVIVGGESGPGARPCNVAWLRGLVGQCKAAGCPVFVKQLGQRPYDTAAADRLPCAQKTFAIDSEQGMAEAAEALGEYMDRVVSLTLRDRKGGNPAEWPEDLRVREFPEVPA
jgi:protein gp37